jgi:hypothetical protein
MSAYLVTPEHIGNLVGWSMQPQRHLHCWNMVQRKPVNLDGGNGTTPYHRGAELARILAEANLASIAARYGAGSKEQERDFVADCIAAARRPNLLLSAKDIYSMATCLDYQSCEVFDWVVTDAYWCIRAIMAEAARVMASGAKINWSYDQDEWDANMLAEREKHAQSFEKMLHS